MKRKWIAVVLVFVVLLGTAGCGGKGNTSDTGTPVDKAVVADYLKEHATVDAADFVPVDEGIIENYYPGLGELSEDYVVLINGTGGLVDEIALVTAKDGVKTAEIKAAMEQRIEAQRERFVDYVPAELPKLDNAAIEIVGDTVILLISGDENPAKLVSDALGQ